MLLSAVGHRPRRTSACFSSRWKNSVHRYHLGSGDRGDENGQPDVMIGRSSRVEPLASRADVSVILDRGAMKLAGIEFLMDMTPFHEFLTQLLDQGKIVFRSTARRAIGRRRRPSRSWPRRSRPTASPWPVLAIAFDPAVACAAAELLRQASWALVNHDDRVTDLEKRLKMPARRRRRRITSPPI